MTGLVKRAFIGTRFEEPLKRAHHLLTGSKSTLYDAQTIAIMRRVLRPDSSALDVGSFEGGMLKHMLRLAPGGAHMAFEPQPERYRALRASFPTVDVRPYAVGDRSAEVPFHCMVQHPALSGLHRRSRDLSRENSREIMVRMEPLDRVVPADRAVHFVKVDVEGAELGVFRGAVSLLKRERPVIVFECGVGGADYFGTSPQEIHDLLTREIGFHVSLLGDWLQGGTPALSERDFVEQFERRIHYYFVAHP